MAILVKLEGGPGGKAKQKGFEDHIECQHMSHGVAQQHSAVELMKNRDESDKEGGGVVYHQEILLQKKVDATSPQLLEACCKATTWDTATIKWAKNAASPKAWFEVELTNVIVSNVTYSSDGIDEGMETFALSYTKAVWTCSKGGNTTGQWDLMLEAVEA